jgi:hypothetical protein
VDDDESDESEKDEDAKEEELEVETLGGITAVRSLSLDFFRSKLITHLLLRCKGIR